LIGGGLKKLEVALDSSVRPVRQIKEHKER
jgi:hypothetical protein